MTYFGADRRNMTAKAQDSCAMSSCTKMTAMMILGAANYYSGRQRGTQPGIDKRFCKGNGLRGTEPQKDAEAASPDPAEPLFLIGKRHPGMGGMPI